MKHVASQACGFTVRVLLIVIMIDLINNALMDVLVALGSVLCVKGN